MRRSIVRPKVNKYSGFIIRIHYNSLFRFLLHRFERLSPLYFYKTLANSSRSIGRSLSHTCVSRERKGLFPLPAQLLLPVNEPLSIEAILNRYDSDTCCGHSKGVINFIRNSDDTLAH